MDPTRTIFAITALAAPVGYACQRDGRTSAEIARDRLLWCQHHDPVTRTSQKRMLREFKEAGYVRKPRWPYTTFGPKSEKRGKPVLTTSRRASALILGRVW